MDARPRDFIGAAALALILVLLVVVLVAGNIPQR
jgi:hypothetical protein